MEQCGVADWTRGCRAAEEGKGLRIGKRWDTRDGGGEAWMEKPTTDEAGSRGLEVEAAPESQDSNDSIRAVLSDSVHGATISRCVVPSGG